MGIILQTIIKQTLSFNISTLIILAFLTQLTTAGNVNYPSNALEKHQKTFDDLKFSSQFNQHTRLNRFKQDRPSDRYRSTQHRGRDRFKRGTVVVPNVNKTLDEIYKSIDEMRQHITILQAGSSNPELSAMISKWNKKVDDFEKLVDNAHNTDKTQELFQLSGRYKQQLEEIAQKQLPDDTVHEIRSNRFSTAEERLLLLDDYSDIQYVVRMVYNNHPDNFNLILRFGISIQNEEFKIEVFNALYELMKEFGNPDIWKLTRLGRAASAVTGSVNVPFNFNDLWNVVLQEKIVKLIADAIINNNSYPMPKQSVNDDSYCFLCLIDIYNKVIQQVWGKVTIWDLFSRAQNDPDYLEGHIAVQLAVANYLKYDFKDQEVIILAKNMKSTMENNLYKKVRQEEKSVHENLKNKLPESIRNLVFSKLLCLKNTKYNENLMASLISSTKDDRNRAIYTVHPASYSDHEKEQWIITFNDHYRVNITNLKYKKPLYASKIDYESDTKRYVYLWKYDCSSSVCFWDVEVDSDGIQLKNVGKKEYLYADYKDGNEGTRSVYTYRPGTRTVDSKWQILDCSTY